MSKRGEKKQDLETVENAEKFTPEGLMKRQWHVYHTSLILNNNVKHLSEVAITAGRILVDSSPRIKVCHVNLTSCPTIQRTELHPPTLLVEVFFDEELVLLGYFLNFSDKTDMSDEHHHLPLYMFKGKAKVAKTINRTLMKVFDCLMFPMAFNQRQLAQLFSIFVHFSEDTDGSATLKFTIPGLSKEDLINISNRVSWLSTVLEFLFQTNDDDDIASMFYERLLQHYQMEYGLRLGHAELCHASLPEAMATADGSIRMDNENLLAATLSLIDTFLPRSMPEVAPSIPSDDS